MSDLQVLCGEFESTAELSLAISSYGWGADIRQLDRGAGAANFKSAMGPASIFHEVFFERQAHQYISPIKGFVNFGLLSDGKSETKIGSKTIASSSLLCMHEDGFESVSMPTFHAYTLSFKESRVLELAESLHITLPDAFKLGLGLEFIPDKGRLARVRAMLSQISVYTQHPDVITEYADDVISLLESDILTQLLLHTSRANTLKPSSPRNRGLVLQRALTYIEANPREALKVEVLCRASASSISTLERAFQEHFGIPPKRYILIQRLQRAHSALICEGRDRKIADIANEWGFWHMGKFASDYRNLFGYLPSETMSHSATPNRVLTN